MAIRLLRLSSPLRLELAHLLQASLPLMLTLVAQVGMGVVDALFLGRLPASQIAGAAISIQGYSFANMTLNGVLSAIGVAWCRARTSSCVLHKRRVLWASYALICVSIVICWAFFLAIPHLFPGGEVAAAAQRYLRPLAYAVPAHLICLAARFLLAAEESVKGLTRIYLGGLVANLIGDFVLVSQFGLEGIAWTTTAVYWLMATCIIASLPWPRLVPLVAWKQLTQMLRLGLPIGAAVAADAGMIAMVTLFFCRCGAHALAAHHFMLQWTYIGFMFPCALSMVTSIRAARYHELGRSQSLTHLMRAALILVMLVSGGIALIVAVALPFLLPYIVPGDASGPSTIRETCMYLIPVVFVYNLSNALQGTLLAVLRGLKETGRPLLYVAGAYWGVGVPLAYSLAGCGASGAAGIWTGLVTGQCILVLMLLACPGLPSLQSTPSPAKLRKR